MQQVQRTQLRAEVARLPGGRRERGGEVVCFGTPEALKRLTQAGVAVKGAIFNGLDLSKRRYGQGGYGYKRYGYRYQAYQYGPAETK